MLASTAAALRPPLRRVRGGAFPSGASHGGTRGAIPLFPRPRRRALACRADLQQDAPFAAAIGACVLASLVLPPPRPRGEEGEEVEEGGEFGATDTRMAVMGIISFLPYFNWLSWIFAWLDSGRRRYLVYAAVYLAPYLRANLSLSPDESWLPIASIFICILHIQKQASGVAILKVSNSSRESFPVPLKRRMATVETREIQLEWEIDTIGEYHQRMNLEKGFAIQISSRGSLMSPTRRSKISQIGTENNIAPVLLYFPDSPESFLGKMHVFVASRSYSPN
ncbi:unnamed protein product [Urochloa decumbens]|uniref:Uncharacterized protein n=1 Tax=Urochloa decumbens TaxID=240449 RepID=A0ABC9C740_9POAL